MRVTLPLLYAATQQNIESRNEKIQGLTRRISSGKQLEAPHDDPRAWAQSRRLTAGLQRLERYKNNLEFANGLTSVAESALDHIHDLLIRAKEIGTAANTPNSSAEKEAYKEDLEQIQEEIMSTAQTKYNGQYVFEGYFDPNPTTPPPDWLSARDTSPPDDARIISVDLDDRATQTEVSVDARSLFQGLMATFEDLKTAIETENSADIANSLSKLDGALDTARALSAQTGARSTAYERRLDALNTFQVHDQDRLSQIQDTDLVEAVTALKQNQIALEAALQSTAALQGLSLTRYL
ncbi:flagellin C-terminal helical region [Desulfacinum hydrothermale DSM 13146]|uniref:Flagellin n=1 Tax=Desulfacinum hydrothermale DSM 13146 TaxID=1121390 RepID=A0A1W1X6D4_9BACT|nr:flagellin [Desulfacinum hydrothermale]SMC19414.1 flagellin C-terminal helical region [Desulfacinum hydrothermale DSM 13146]